MTACNVILHAHAAHMLTDGQTSVAAKVADGRKSCASKVWVMPHLNAAMVISGPYLVGPIAHWALSRGSTSYESLRRNAVDLLKWVEKDLDAVLSVIADRRIGLTVAGIDGAGRADSFVVANFARDDPGQDGPGEVWRVVPNGPVGMQPSSSKTLARFQATFPDAASGDDIDPVRDGIRMMEMQREEDPAFGVGGFVQLTTVSLAGITSRIIHRWHEDEFAHEAA